jgi:hypothetical protein
VLCHDKDYSDYDFNNDSVVIDVYRKFKTDRKDLRVLYYGKTAKQNQPVLLNNS